ncbi:MAG TPA: peptide chain release factor N(5)-glutamine methyltransferase [Candidatus Acidoferrum sp.]|nr:peptide chain release factor N(5)-glutamine methyltransferase [Candidatus Acidoferrum sp.]
MPNLRAALADATTRLGFNDTAALDAQILLAHVLGKSRAWLYTWPAHELDAEQSAQYEALVKRAAAGEPVAYLTGKRAFWTLTLDVSPAVLIPRPETELLVELALELGQTLPGPVADLGTGSGAIALALASERPDWQLHATEFSPPALEVARANAQRLQLDNVHCFGGSWCEPLPAPAYSLIVSNPPYIAADDPHLPALAHEPRSALVATADGLADLQAIVQQARTRLADGGWLLLEHGWQQGAAVRGLLERSGYRDIVTRQDAGGRDRVTLGLWKGTAHE